MNVVLRIEGAPRGWQRSRVNHAQRRHFEDPKTERGYANVLIAWHEAGSPRLPDGPLAIQFEAVLARPQGHWRKDGTLSAAGQRLPWPTKKPDVDNALKLVMDALNTKAYRDDVQIVTAWVSKRWAQPAEPEHTSVVLTPLPEINLDQKAAV